MIDVLSLSKTYCIHERSSGVKAAIKQFIKPTRKEVHALKDVSFHINEGEIVGYMGPNGAGKSTSIKMMSGILRPSSGMCVIDGLIPWESRKEHVEKIGVVFGQRSQLWWDTPVIDSFELLKAIYKIPEKAYRLKLEELTEAMDLRPLLKVPVRQLSLGQRMRCEVAASLLHSPKILFLDEPTIGLDVPSKIAIRTFIKQMNETKRVTVILTTHDTSDLEALCQRVMLIGRGALLYDGDFQELKEKHAPERRMEIEVFQRGELTAPAGWQIDENQRLVKEFNPKIDSVNKLLAEITQKYDIVDMKVSSAPVDEIVSRLYQEHRL